MIKNKFAGLFWKGFFTILPIYLTCYFIYWLVTNVENMVGQLLKTIIGAWYFPGLGLLIATAIIFVVGILMQVYIAQYIVKIVEKLVQKIPLIGDLYSSIQSLAKYFSSSDEIKGKEVVMVNINGVELLGITTRSDFSNAPKGIVEKENIISVYIPMSYQIGGFSVYVDRSKARKVDMPQKSALKWALIGGIEE